MGHNCVCNCVYEAINPMSACGNGGNDQLFPHMVSTPKSSVCLLGKWVVTRHFHIIVGRGAAIQKPP